jgi:copper(I)-binding protein
MTIEGGSSSDTLTAADADVCGDAQLHETVMNDGVMSMQHLPDGIPVAAGESVRLEPGSFHVMCIDTQRDLVAGESIDLSLTFADAGPMSVSVEIRDQ